MPVNDEGGDVASLYLIVPVALLFCALAVAAWLWATRSGQFDDLDREARRILQDEPVVRPPAAGAGDNNCHNDSNKQEPRDDS